MKTSLQPAQLEWTDKGLPFAPQFGDYYFSRENGLAESRHTFLTGNDISERFSQLESRRVFSLIETGFGTGLNFLATLKAWRENRTGDARLDYISIEAHPLRPADLQRALALWPELADEADLLIEHYPLLTPGFHCIAMEPGVRLILIFAEVREALEQLAGPRHPELARYQPFSADAWYLDGFAPAVNAHMWDEALFPLMRLLSKADSSLATFTAAGSVRRGLTAAGFEMTRVPGYGRKREMLRGRAVSAISPAPPSIYRSRKKAPAFWSLSSSSPTPAPESVVILGAGIAGVTLAARLAAADVDVRLIDANGSAMQGASGNSQAALFARLSAETGGLEDFALASLTFAQRFYRTPTASPAFENCGLIQLPREPGEQTNLIAVANRFIAAETLVQFACASELSERAGIDIRTDGLWFPQSGWIQPDSLAQHLLDHPRINTQFHTQIGAISRSGNSWLLYDKGDHLLEKTDCLILCMGHGTPCLPGLEWLPTRAIRGQVSLIQSHALDGLKTIICAQGYLTPALDGGHSLGATYDPDNNSTELLESDHRENLAILHKMLGQEKAEITGGRAGVRCATPDYLPICGPAPDPARLREDFSILAKDARRLVHHPGATQPGLYLNLGFGSRGYCYAPLCAEHLASLILGQVSPLSHNLATAIHPSRFIIRDIIRGKAPDSCA